MQQRIESYYDGRQSFTTFMQPEKDKTKIHKTNYEIANEFRDSFRIIKSALIKDNNMLDASNYHRIELYCKELELEYKKEEEPQKSGIRDFVDRIQLYCYRLTSDHHTNLLLILNNIIFLIALFGLANLMLIPIDKTYTVSFTILFFKLNMIEWTAFP